MCRFIETIQVRDGKLQNLAHHNRRMNETRQAVFGMADQLDILDYTEDCPESGFYKCRVVYGREVCEVAFSAYTMLPVPSGPYFCSDNQSYPNQPTGANVQSSLYKRKMPLHILLCHKLPGIYKNRFQDNPLYNPEYPVDPPLLSRVTPAVNMKK